MPLPQGSNWTDLCRGIDWNLESFELYVEVLRRWDSLLFQVHADMTGGVPEHVEQEGGAFQIKEGVLCHVVNSS
jgi:hypothetical protein